MSDKSSKDKSKDKKKKTKPVSPEENAPVVTTPLSPLFGAPIEDAARRSDPILGAVPLPIKRAVEYLNERGLREEGLYRVPGSHQQFLQYKQQFDEGQDVDFIKLDVRSPENVAMVIIKYLQALPDPLITRKWEPHFKLGLGLESTKSKEECVHVLKEILRRIPYSNRETIRLLADHLKRVAAQHEKNKMTARNIELTWSLSVGGVTGGLMKVLIENDVEIPSTVQFGLPLRVACRNSEIPDDMGPFAVPAVIRKTVNWIRTKNGFVTDVLNGELDDPMVEELKFRFNSGNHELADDLAPSVVGSLLRTYFAELPESLFTAALHEKFGTLADIANPDEQSKKLLELAIQLPVQNLETIKFFALFMEELVAKVNSVSIFMVGAPFGDEYMDKFPILVEHVTLLQPLVPAPQLPPPPVDEAAPAKKKSKKSKSGDTSTKNSPSKVKSKTPKKAKEGDGAVSSTSSGSLKKKKKSTGDKKDKPRKARGSKSKADANGTTNEASTPTDASTTDIAAAATTNGDDPKNGVDVEANGAHDEESPDESPHSDESDSEESDNNGNGSDDENLHLNGEASNTSPSSARSAVQKTSPKIDASPPVQAATPVIVTPTVMTFTTSEDGNATESAPAEKTDSSSVVISAASLIGNGDPVPSTYGTSPSSESSAPVTFSVGADAPNGPEPAAAPAPVTFSISDAPAPTSDEPAKEEPTAATDEKEEKDTERASPSTSPREPPTAAPAKESIATTVNDTETTPTPAVLDEVVVPSATSTSSVGSPPATISETDEDKPDDSNAEVEFKPEMPSSGASSAVSSEAPTPTEKKKKKSHTRSSTDVSTESDKKPKKEKKSRRTSDGPLDPKDTQEGGHEPPSDKAEGGEKKKKKKDKTGTL